MAGKSTHPDFDLRQIKTGAKQTLNLTRNPAIV